MKLNFSSMKRDINQLIKKTASGQLITKMEKKKQPKYNSKYNIV